MFYYSTVPIRVRVYSPNADYSISWKFRFNVKFYPSEVSTLHQDLTRYLLSLQLRQDLYTGVYVEIMSL